MVEPLNTHSALIYVMVTMAAVDRTMTDQELTRIGHVVSHLPAFEGFEVDRLVRVAESCGDILSEDGGLDTVLSMVSEALPKKLKETAYALAVEVAAADLDVRQEELRLLEMLRDAFQLDKLTTAAIERGASARHAVA